MVELDGQSYHADDTPTGLDFAPGSFTLAAWINVENVASNQWQAILECDRFDAEPAL
ncbi:MAG: hypothetical protein ACLFV7_05280 [Phycisphaerae bacterium]